MNLINLLPQKDKELMEKYIYLYGTKNFIGLDEYLKHWEKSKKKLYRLLGGKFQLEIPYSCSVTEEEMRARFFKFLKQSVFIEKFQSFISEKRMEAYYDNLLELVYTNTYVENKISKTIKFKTKENKEICLQKGMKPVRALQKIVHAFPEYFSKETFEDFRIKHSLCLNDKILKGTLVLSIHPFDFITMSDNNSDWSSCMSWMNEGCYHLGTVEMMNSNNVIVAYLKSETTPFYFGEKDKEEKWNNKKWRQLIYVTKDIIVSGKSYPYTNKDISMIAIEKIKKLAEQNLSWTYTFGPEKYQDMKHINSLEAMENNKHWLKNGDSFKHNIIFDTKAMYNDMVSDNDVDYWCYRNKVKRMKIISISGKAPCACCGENAIREIAYADNYHDRWEDPERIICHTCWDATVCNYCNSSVDKSQIGISPFGDKICSHCSHKIKKCPCCGEWFIFHNHSQLPGIVIKDSSIKNKTIYYNHYMKFNNEYYYKNPLSSSFLDYENHIRPYKNMPIIPAFMCNNCITEEVNDPNGLFIKKEIFKDPVKSEEWHSKSKIKAISKIAYTEDEIAQNPKLNKLIFKNLECYKIS